MYYKTHGTIDDDVAETATLSIHIQHTRCSFRACYYYYLLVLLLKGITTKDAGRDSGEMLMFELNSQSNHTLPYILLQQRVD